MKPIRLITALVALIVISSCTPVIYPKPDKSTVNFSYEKQNKTVHVKDIDGIEAADKSDYVNYGSGFAVIKHGDWLKMVYNKTHGSDGNVKIYVEENTSFESRSYTLTLKYKGFPIPLDINQSGRHD